MCECVDRQVEVLIQELVVLVQRSEEYTYFLTSHMRDAVARDTEKQQAAAAAAAQRLSRRPSMAQPDTPAARDQKGVLLVVLLFSGDCIGCGDHFPSCVRNRRECGQRCVCLLCCCAVVQLFWTPLWLPCSSTWGSVKHGCAQVGYGQRRVTILAQQP
jgi:hypothetical protein